VPPIVDEVQFFKYLFIQIVFGQVVLIAACWVLERLTASKVSGGNSNYERRLATARRKCQSLFNLETIKSGELLPSKVLQCCLLNCFFTVCFLLELFKFLYFLFIFYKAPSF
jgi:hypothetical protein